MALPSPSPRICPQCGAETQAAFCHADGYATVERARVMPRDPAQRIGEVLAQRYRLDQPLGQGPLGLDFRATDLARQLPVHLRLLPPALGSDLHLVARFQREGRLLAGLSHPNIAQTFEHGLAEDGSLFIAQELVLAPTLGELLTREGPFDPRRVAALGMELLAALAAAHAAGALHRSLGLHNALVVSRPNAPETLKVRDFGLARVLADDEAHAFVWPPQLVQAWPTMAPEQARGRGVSGHADLYSVGAILYALLTGRPVFSETAPSDLLVAHNVKLPAPPERDGRILSGPLVELITRCLEKKPWNRPDGAARARELLEAARAEPVALPPAAPASPASDLSTSPDDPSSRTRGVRPTTNPYAPAPPPNTRPSPRPDTRPPDKPRRLSGPGGRRPSEPTVVHPVVPSPSEVLITRPTPQPTDDFDPDLVLPRRMSPALAFTLGLLLAGGLAALVVLLTRPAEPPAAPAPITPSAAAPPDAAGPAVSPDTSPGPDTAPAPDTVPAPDTAPAPAPDTAPVPGDAQAATPDTLAPPPDAGPAPTPAPPGTPRPARPPRPDGARTPSAPVDPLADLEDPDLAARPAIVMRRVLVDSDPIGATVTANGRPLGETPLYVEWQEGTLGVDITVAKPGHRPVQAKIGPGVGKQVKLTLPPSGR